MAIKTPFAAPAAVALLGLGNMGVPIGARLVKAGYSVTGYDRSERARQNFNAAGGRTAMDLASATATADVVLLLLPDGEIVRNVVSETLAYLRHDAGTVIVDMSSSDPVGTRKLGTGLAAAGFEFVDAPVSGGVKRAVNGTLAIMAGGAAATIDRLQPLFEAVGTAIFRTGALGSRHAMKALNNYVSAAGLIATVEALQIGRNFGLDPSLMTDILNASTGRNNTTEVKLRQFILSKSFDSGFPLRLMAKDVRTANGMAHALELATPFVELCARIWEAAARELGEGADHTEVIRYLERLA